MQKFPELISRYKRHELSRNKNLQLQTDLYPAKILFPWFPRWELRGFFSAAPAVISLNFCLFTPLHSISYKSKDDLIQFFLPNITCRCSFAASVASASYLLRNKTWWSCSIVSMLAGGWINLQYDMHAWSLLLRRTGMKLVSLSPLAAVR